MTTTDIDANRRIPVAAEPANNTFVVWYDPNREPYAVYFRSDTNAWDDDQRWFNADQAGGDLDGPYSWDNLREELRGNDGPHLLVPAAKVDELTAALIDEQASHQATLRNQSALSAEVQQLRAELETANRRNDGLQADLDSATKANTAWANENAELRKQVCLIVTCQGCGEAYEYDGGTVHFSNPDQAQSMVEDDEWRRIGNEFVCGGCIYEPHPFIPAVNDETTCARCDIEADEHEPVKAEAVAL